MKQVASERLPDSTWAVLRVGDPEPLGLFRDRYLAEIQAGCSAMAGFKSGDDRPVVVRLWSFGTLRPDPRS